MQWLKIQIYHFSLIDFSKWIINCTYLSFYYIFYTSTTIIYFLRNFRYKTYFFLWNCNNKQDLKNQKTNFYCQSINEFISSISLRVPMRVFCHIKRFSSNQTLICNFHSFCCKQFDFISVASRISSVNMILFLLKLLEFTIKQRSTNCLFLLRHFNVLLSI